MDWFNNQYIKKTELDRLVDLALPLLEQGGYLEEDPEDDELETLKEVLGLIRPSLEKLTDLKDHRDLEIFYGSLDLDSESREVLRWDSSPTVLRKLKENLNQKETITPDEVSTLVKEVKEEVEVGYKEVYKPLRAAITGKISGPEIKEVVSILGPAVASERLDSALEDLD